MNYLVKTAIKVPNYHEISIKLTLDFTKFGLVGSGFIVYLQ